MSADNQYYNAIIANNSNNFVNAKYSAALTNPIIDNPSEYYLSIIRFTIPAANIPIFIYDPLVNYKVSLSYNGFSASQALTYIPTTILTPAQAGEFYYYVNSYQLFIDMINKAYLAAFTTLSGLTALPVGVTHAPWLIYNAETELISLIAQKEYTTEPSNASVKVWSDISILRKLEGFEYKSNAFNPATTNGQQFQLSIKNNSNNILANVVAPDGTALTNCLEMKQEYPTLYRWNDVRSIVFLADNMPVNQEIYPSGSSLPTDPTTASYISQGISLYNPVLTDFEIATGKGPDALSSIQYVPQSQWRFVDLQSTQPLRKIGFIMKWADTFGNLHDFSLTPGDSITVKIAFLKKDLVKRGVFN